MVLSILRRMKSLCECLTDVQYQIKCGTNDSSRGQSVRRSVRGTRTQRRRWQSFGSHRLSIVSTLWEKGLQAVRTIVTILHRIHLDLSTLCELAVAKDEELTPLSLVFPIAWERVRSQQSRRTKSSSTMMHDTVVFLFLIFSGLAMKTDIRSSWVRAPSGLLKRD